MGQLRGCAWGLGLVLLLSEAGVAMPEPMILVQQGETASTDDETRAAAQRAYDEGVELYRQGTAESLRQAIEKWEIALTLWQELGDREWEATTLNNIGWVYSNLGEKQTIVTQVESFMELIIRF